MLLSKFLSGKFTRFFGLLLVWLLVGCGLRLDIFPTPTIEPSLIDTSILTGVPCQAPCWYGLVPGRSTKAEALAIVQSLPFIDPKALSEEPYRYWDTTKEGQVPGTLVRFRCKRPGVASCVVLVVVNDVVKQILLSAPPSLTVRDVVAHLGPPEFVSASRIAPEDAGTCDVGLIWKERAVTAEAGRGPCADISSGKPINPDRVVTGLLYTSAEDAVIRNAPEQGPYFPWPGLAKP